ncbi:MAG TPA: EF-P beta-lysylation protein EpmB [Thioalkalivibrio sp.]|nr:EF-P beta-lysylation protein EpmB [Thioalkalivibrio sp.]
MTNPLAPARHPASWQQELAEAVTDPAELLRRVALPDTMLEAARAAGRQFRLRVPQGYVARMRRGDPTDPLLRQVLPLADELVDVPGYVHDPVGDLDAMTTPGLLHKYRGRALLVTTGACAVHCRYCFRRHFPYGEANPAREDWQAAIDHLRDTPSITEIILSGGDPLVLSNERLGRLLSALEGIGHLKRLRIHSRLPVVLPARVDASLLRLLSDTRLQPVMVIHANHANEFDTAVGQALAALRAQGVTLLNQTVLLRGVNDTAEALGDLSEILFDNGVLPYYLHLLDRVAGAGHFDVPAREGQALIETLRTRLPGYLVPRLVREIAGEPGKHPIA